MPLSTSVLSRLQPPPEDGSLWTDILHWCICALEPNDPDISFVAGLFSYAHSQGGLTEKQARFANNIFKRLCAEYELQK